MKQITNLNFFGKDAKFHHAGFAVRSIDNLVKATEKIMDQIQNVNVTLVNINGFPAELVEPLNENSPIGNLLKKQQSLYHLCFEVKTIEKAIKIARKHGFHCIAAPLPARAFESRRIAWLFSRNYGLFELLEE